MDKKVRIVKKHNERKQEIIDTALKIFIHKGYEKTSVNDILNEIGIAKGTFYHYFKAKEEVLDAVIADTTETIVNKIEKIIADNSLNAEDKLLKAFSEMRVALIWERSSFRIFISLKMYLCIRRYLLHQSKRLFR